VDEERARLRRDVIWNLAPLVLLGGVGIGMQFAIAAWWGAETLAVFDLVRIVFFVSAVLGAFGLQYAVLRAVAEAPDDRDRVSAVVVGALVPNVALAAVMTGAFLALRRPVGALLDSDAVAEGMLWAAPGLFCFAVNKVLLGVVNGLRRMRAFAIYTSLRYLLLATGLVLAHLWDIKAAHLSVIWTFTEGTMLLVLLGELVTNVSLARAAGWRTYTRQHLDYGARGVTATLASEINTKLDVWMLGAAHLDKALVGIYVLAAALMEGATQLGVVVANNLNPVLARELATAGTDDVVALARRTRRWFVPAVAGACALGAVMFPVVIPILVGNADFARGAGPFAILMGGLALASPYLPFSQILLMGNRPGWHTLLLVLVVATNFTLDLVLIPPLGLHGAAIATACSVITLALLVRTFARYRLGAKI
jgi:O-antigen/teichoic acid export membrane protein